MRTFPLLLGLALAAFARPTSALEMSGRIGLFYDRTETWSPGEHSIVPRLQLDGAAQANGPIVDLGSWRGAVGYQRLRRTFSDSEESTNQLTYSGLLTLLESRDAPASLFASADRTVADFATDTGVVRSTGTRIDTTYGGRLNLNNRALPKLSLGGWLRDSSADGFAAAPRTESAKLLEIATQHGPGSYDVNLAYQGRWNSGTFDILDYRSHAFDLTASSQFGAGVDGFVTGQYYLRTPETLSRENPRLERNHLVAGVRMLTPDDRGRVQYAYDHFFFESPLTGERERIRQTVSGRREIVHGPTWESIWGADVSVNQDRAGGLEDSAYGASFSPVARWRARSEARDVLVEVGPVIGVLKPTDADAELGTGAHWRGRAGWNAPFRYSLDYGGDWGRNLGSVRGWTLTQAVTGALEGSMGTARARAAVTVSASRQHAEVFGDAAARDVVLAASLVWRRVSATVDAGLRDGTSPAVAGVGGDALFIPSAFDSHSQYAALSVTIEPLRHLKAVGRARYGRFSGPDLPDQQEAAVYGALQYAFGQMQVSVEDRYSAGGPSSFDRRVNEILVRVSRTFDARY